MNRLDRIIWKDPTPEEMKRLQEIQRVRIGWGLGIMVQSEQEAARLNAAPHPKASEIAAERLKYEPWDYTERS